MLQSSGNSAYLFLIIFNVFFATFSYCYCVSILSLSIRENSSLCWHYNMYQVSTRVHSSPLRGFCFPLPKLFEGSCPVFYWILDVLWIVILVWMGKYNFPWKNENGHSTCLYSSLFRYWFLRAGMKLLVYSTYMSKWLTFIVWTILNLYF